METNIIYIDDPNTEPLTPDQIRHLEAWFKDYNFRAVTLKLEAGAIDGLVNKTKTKQDKHMENLNNPEIDPLSQAAGGIDTSFPILQDGQFLRFECRSAEKVKSKEKNIEMLVLKVVTTKDAIDNNNQPLNPGFPVYVRTTVEATEKRDMTAVAKDLAQILKAFGMPDKSPRQLLDDPSLLVGQVADAKVGVLPEKNGFPPSNVLRWKLPA